MGGDLELGKHCHILEKCLLALLIPIPLYSYTSPLPTPVSPGKQIEKSQRRKPAYTFISVFFFFFSCPISVALSSNGPDSLTDTL